MRGIGAEANCHQAVAAGCHERVHYGSELVRPFGASGENNRSGAADFPFSLWITQRSTFVGDPAMAKDFQMEVWNFVEIGFKSDSLLLLSPNRKKPLDGNRAGTESDCNPRVIKPITGEAQVGLQAAGIQPMGLDNASTVGAGELHPAQRQRTFLAVVTGEKQIPQADQASRAQNVNDQETPHRIL